MPCKFKVGDIVYNGEYSDKNWKDSPWIVVCINELQAGTRYDMDLQRLNKRTLKPVVDTRNYCCYDYNARFYEKHKDFNWKQEKVIAKIKYLDQRFKEKKHVKV
jgi:hypothetical protein